MNEFQRRALDILNQTDYISSVAKPGRTIVNIDYFAYTLRLGTDAVPVPLLTPTQGLMEMQSDSDFVATFVSGGQQLTAGAPLSFNGPVLLQFVDTGSGKSWFNTPTLMPLVCGAGGFPFLLPSPRVLNPNTNLEITASIIGPDTMVGIYVVLHGSRIFYAS